MASTSIPALLATPGALLATPGTPAPSTSVLASLGRDPLLHATVRKSFGSQWFVGKVVAVDVDPSTEERAYHVVYDDGDDEHMREAEVRFWMGESLETQPREPVRERLPEHGHRETHPGAMACAVPQARAPRGVSPLRYPAAAPARRPSLVPGRTLPREQCQHARPGSQEHAQPGRPPAQIGASQFWVIAALMLAGVWGVALLWTDTTAADVDPIADFGALEWQRHMALGLSHANAHPQDTQAHATHGIGEPGHAKPVSQSIPGEVLQHVAQAQDSSSSELSPKTTSAVPSPLPRRVSDTSPLPASAPSQVSETEAPDKERAADVVANITGLLMVVLGFALFWKPVHRDLIVSGVADPICLSTSTSPLPCAPNASDVPIPSQRLEQPGTKALCHEPSLPNGGNGPDHTLSFFEPHGADAVLREIHNVQDENNPLAANAQSVGKKRRAGRDGPSEKRPRREQAPQLVAKDEGIRNRFLQPPGEGRFRHVGALRKLAEMGFDDTPDLRCVLAGNQGNVGATLRDMGLA